MLLIATSGNTDTTSCGNWSAEGDLKFKNVDAPQCVTHKGRDSDKKKHSFAMEFTKSTRMMHDLGC